MLRGPAAVSALAAFFCAVCGAAVLKGAIVYVNAGLTLLAGGDVSATSGLDERCWRVQSWR